MILIEETQVADADLPVDLFKEHLRIGTGFTEGDVQDSVLRAFLRAALAAIEGRCSRALMQRRFLLTLETWRAADVQVLPVAPVQSIVDVSVVDRFGAATLIAAAQYRLRVDSFSPAVVAVGSTLPGIPAHGTAEVRFDAGYGTSFDSLPPDLAQAVLLLAAHYYEYRDETALGQGCMPFGVTSLVARYRPVRVGLTA